MQKNIQILTLNKDKIVDFAKERNNLLKKSKSEWNLFLDTDETISHYKLQRNNYFLKQFVGSEKITRLVKKNTGKWVRSVHEVWKPNEIVITHNTADNLADYINKINNYSTLHALENKKENKKASLFKIIVFPAFKFILTLIKSKNIVFSIMQSLHSYLSWTKMYFRPEQK